jgi:hypothetical protein
LPVGRRAALQLDQAVIMKRDGGSAALSRRKAMNGAADVQRD